MNIMSKTGIFLFNFLLMGTAWQKIYKQQIIEQILDLEQSQHM